MATPRDPTPCRLCGDAARTSHFHANKFREYMVCRTCHAIFVPDSFLISPERERAEYEKHDNFNEDEGYKRFLSRAIEPLCRYLLHFRGEQEEVGRDTPPTHIPLKGLDFGCGPNPLLAKLLSAPPYKCDMDYFDKYFFPDNVNLAEARTQYAFITTTEVLEHLHDPLREVQSLWRLLAPNGILVIMTKRAEGSVDTFKNWHYQRDPTHVIFFTEDAFRWLADQLSASGEWECEVTFDGKDIAVLHKRARK